MRHVAKTIALLLPLLIAATTSADQTLPLGDRYRVGQYLPVRTDADVSIAGGLPVQIKPVSKSASAVVPMLVVSSLDAPGQSFRALGDDDRLIGATTPDADLAAEVFPGRTFEFAALNLADPLPGPATANQFDNGP